MKFTEKIYESQNKTAVNTDVKIKYCIKEPNEYNFYSYDYDVDAIFSDKEINELTKGFSYVEEKVFKKGEDNYFSKKHSMVRSKISTKEKRSFIKKTIYNSFYSTMNSFIFFLLAFFVLQILNMKIHKKRQKNFLKKLKKT